MPRQEEGVARNPAAVLPQDLAAQVCMVLRFEAEEVTQSAEAIEEEPRRALLGGLVGSLDAVLPFLAAALEASYGRAQEARAQGDAGLAAAQAAVVSAALGARQGEVPNLIAKP